MCACIFYMKILLNFLENVMFLGSSREWENKLVPLFIHLILRDSRWEADRDEFLLLELGLSN